MVDHTMEKSLDEVALFLSRLQYNTQPIVLITSGGTRVPLEKNMVRFLDNFSGGDRGATSAEYFLARGYAVVFMHRTGSKTPLSRAFSRAVSDRVDDKLIRKLVCKDESEHASLHISPTAHEVVLQEAHLARKGVSQGYLMLLDFVTVQDYLFLLEKLSQLLSPFGPRVCMFLAAAVSDFYIPDEQMSVHKIQSDQGNLTLELQQVPKLLGRITSHWAPHAFVVSFKLETDTNMLQKKAEAALEKYRVHLVVANLLQTRKDIVYLVSRLCPSDGFAFSYSTNANSNVHSNAEIDEREAKSMLQELKRPSDTRCIEMKLIEQVTLRHLSFLTAQYQAFHFQHLDTTNNKSINIVNETNSWRHTGDTGTNNSNNHNNNSNLLHTVAALRREFAELAPSRRFPQQMKRYLQSLDSNWEVLTRPAMTKPRALTQTEEEEERADTSHLLVNYLRLAFWSSMMMSLSLFCVQKRR